MFIPKKKLTLSVGLIAIIGVIIWMWATGTLSYPWIMLDRQAQLISRCMVADSSFSADAYGFSFLAPSDFCILPHRQFPADASIQVIPRGYYFVFNEYAKGTIVSAARASILFDRRTRERSAEAFLVALDAGGFLEGATVERHTNGNGIPLIIVRNAKGIDGDQRFLWAFADHPSKAFSITIISAHPEDPAVFEAVLDGLKST